jgi:hypothetical protein
MEDETYLEPSTGEMRTYEAGDVVEFRVGVGTHHWGHYEFRLCKMSLDKKLLSKQAGQDCLDQHVLHRADRNPSCGSETLGDCQYKNPKHPGRWYLPPPGSETPFVVRGNDANKLKPTSPNDEVHVMRYMIPANVSCEHCTLQWYYATGNACAYDEDYLSFDPGFKFWNFYKADWATAQNSVCGPSGNGFFGEEFWNCADVRVVGGSSFSEPSPLPTLENVPTPIPTSVQQTRSPTVQMVPPTPNPTPITLSPTQPPTPEPSELQGASGSCRNPVCGCPPFEGGASWCTEESSRYGEWCQKNDRNCGLCGAVWCEPSANDAVGFAEQKSSTGRKLRFRRQPQQRGATDDVLMQLHMEKKDGRESDRLNEETGQLSDEL